MVLNVITYRKKKNFKASQLMGERREERTSLVIQVDDWVFDNCKSFIIVFLENLNHWQKFPVLF